MLSRLLPPDPLSPPICRLLIMGPARRSRRKAPPPYREAGMPRRTPDALLFTPTDDSFPDVRLPLMTTPVLPGSATLPGYYGSNHSYDYQGPYYGRARSSTTGTGCLAFRGVYGYC